MDHSKGTLHGAFVAALFLIGLALTGCEQEMRDVATSSDPTQIVTQVISIYGLMTLVFICCAEMSLRKGLLYAAQWTGVILIFLSPLRYIATHDVTTSVAVGLAGAFAAGFSRFMLRPQKKLVKQVLDETAEERIRRLEEENRALEARLNEQERRMDGKKPPHR